MSPLTQRTARRLGHVVVLLLILAFEAIQMMISGWVAIGCITLLVGILVCCALTVRIYRDHDRELYQWAKAHIQERRQQDELDRRTTEG